MTRLTQIASLTFIAIIALPCLPEASAAETKKEPDIKRGEYLVKNVTMCADCHTPRDQKGQFVEGQWLMGSTLTFAPTVPMPVWANVATPLAGLPTFATDEEAIALLMTGKRPSAPMPPRPPMPTFQMNHEDASDVVAYLRSLKK